MSGWRLVKLNFGRNPAHFGELGIGIEETSERVRSDTLFSAWLSAYARLFGKDAVEQLLKQFLDSATPPVQMSSTFVYRYDGKQTIYYLPRPLTFPVNYPADDGTDEGDLKFFKTYKKLSYLPLEVWQQWYQGEGFRKSDRAELIAETQGKSDGWLRQAGTFDYKKAFETDRVPKIAVDRITRATNLYHTGFVQFQWEPNDNDIKSLSGLYFLLYFSKTDQKLEENVRAALHLLGEEGIGGERSSGAGRFQVEWLELSDPSLPNGWREVVKCSEQSACYCLMSLFWDDELSKLEQLIKDASYEIQARGGWIASPFSGRQLRRKTVRMFVEGSVFPEKTQGKLANVTPTGFTTHSIYRNGISLSLPIKIAVSPKSQP